MPKLAGVAAAEPVAALDLEQLQALPHHQAHSLVPRVLLNLLRLQGCRLRLQQVCNRLPLQVFNRHRLPVCNHPLHQVRGPQIRRIGTPERINPRIQAARSREEPHRSSERSSSNKVVSKAQSVAQAQLAAALSKMRKQGMNAYAAT